MRYIAILLTLFTGIHALVAAGNTDNLLGRLSVVNAQWKQQPECQSVLRNQHYSKNVSYNQLIALHLSLVEKTLRARSTSGLSATQKAKRCFLLDQLHCYLRAGRFPVNNYLPYVSPVFIDQWGTHCAVGYLMQQSGAEGLAEKISNNEKFAYVHSISTTGVKQWADENGFTIDELAWIQPGYPPATVFSPVGAGTNGGVKMLCNVYNQGTNVMAVAGAFDTLNGMPCVNMGYYENNQLSCYGNGLAGTVNGIFSGNNEIVAGGSFPFNDTIYPIAFFDFAWNYMSIPNRPNAVCTAIVYGGSDYFAKLAITSDSTPGFQEIWRRDLGGNWSREALVAGSVRTMRETYLGWMYGGAFDTLIVFTDSLNGTAIAAHNVVRYDDISDVWYGVGIMVSDTVLCISQTGMAIYLGGVGSTAPGHSNICLTRYLNNTLQPLVYSSSFFSDTMNAIYDIEQYSASELLIAGNFIIEANGTGYYGDGLGIYDLEYDLFYAYANLDSSVTSVCSFNNNWYMGGNFTTDYPDLDTNINQRLSHLAQIDATTGISNLTASQAARLYPNPASDIVMVSNLPPRTPLIVSNMLGQVVLKDIANTGTKVLDISGLAPGMYFVNNMKLVKQ